MCTAQLWLSEDIKAVYKYFKGVNTKEGEELFCLVLYKNSIEHRIKTRNILNYTVNNYKESFALLLQGT